MTMNITCAIIDDEPLALELLENYVSRVPFLKLTGKYTSAIEALARIKEDGTQLLFLDIQMPDLNGLEFSRIIDSSTKVVFTTAFSEYAIESYRSQALDYLLKPINFTDFMNAANKALKWFELQKKAESAQKHEESDKIYVRSEHKLIAVALDEIIYIEALKDYVMIYILSGAKHLFIQLQRCSRSHKHFLPTGSCEYIAHILLHSTKFLCLKATQLL